MSNNSSMGGLAGLLLVFLVALVAGLIYTLSRVESELLARLLAILVVCVSLSILAIALGLGASLWRKAGHPPAQETKYIMHTKEKTYDGRPQPAPQIMTLPQAANADFPSLLEAAYNAGVGAARGAVRDERGEPTRAGLGDVWDGQAFDEYQPEERDWTP
jgi:hypothetical protein